MTKKKRNPLLWIGLVAVVLIVVAVLAKQAGLVGGGEKLEVAVEKPMNRDISETVTASGKIHPETEVKISADVSGEIVELHVIEGQKVKKGQLLAKINPEIYVSSMERAVASSNNTKASLANARARLLQAESQFEKTESNFRRNEKLYKDGAISTAEFENVKSAYEVSKADVEASRQSVIGAGFSVKSAEASVKESNENLMKTSIIAPVDGTISKLNVEKGERVVGTLQMTGTEMMRIANLTEMEVSVDVSESDIVRVKLGDTSSIDVDAYPERKFKGTVTEIANTANTLGTSADQVTNFTVKIRIARESYGDLIDTLTNKIPFRPGMSATVDIETKKKAGVLSIPIQAVTTRDTITASFDKKKAGGDEAEEQELEPKATSKSTASSKVQEYVFVVRDGKAQMVKVKTGIQDNTYIEVLEGLADSDEVITGPYSAISRTLKQDKEVTVVPKDKLFSKEKK